MIAIGLISVARALALTPLPKPIKDAVLFILQLPPEVRDTSLELIRMIWQGDHEAARRAYEAARQAAFVNRQR